MVGLIRGVSEGLGPVGGAAAIYSLSGLLLIFTVGFPRIRQIPKGYLLAGSLLFVSYEICLALSLGYAATRHQAIEVGMVNYLWPSLTILFAILFNGQKTNWLIVPGLLLALVGVCWVLGGDNGLHYDEIINNITTSPLSYFLAFIGAFIWAVYCTVTNKYARGFNGITVFVLLTGASLWVYYFLTPQPEMVFSTPVMIKLICGIYLRICLCCMECRYITWQRHHNGGRFVFYARPFLSACSRAAQRPAVVLVLARRANGLRRFPALLAGDTSWLK